MPKKISEDHLPMDGPGRKELEKLYAMTEDQAMKKTDSWFKKEHPSGVRSPIEKWAAAQELKFWCEQYKKGKKPAVLEGLYLCTFNDLPIPRWLTLAYLKAFRNVVHYRAKSWDDVFGKPHKKGAHVLTADREQREKSLGVYLRVKELLRTKPNDKLKAHFKQAGKDFGIGSTTKASDWYYEWKERLEICPAKTSKLSGQPPID